VPAFFGRQVAGFSELQHRVEVGQFQRGVGFQLLKFFDEAGQPFPVNGRRPGGFPRRDGRTSR
jgi:hypothetical protein